MNITEIIADKSIKRMEKRLKIEQALKAGLIGTKDIVIVKDKLGEKDVGIILEAMEAVTGKSPEIANLAWLHFSQGYIGCKDNTLKREASRVVGNIAHLFAESLEDAIKLLMQNTKNEGTVVRWGSVYALARIIALPQYANSLLYNTLTDLAQQENENGVKNQYLNGLKKAKKCRANTIPR